VETEQRQESSEEQLKKKRILIAITNRSSYSKLKTVMSNLDRGDVDVHLLLGGSLFLYRYGRAVDTIFNDFPDLPFSKVSLACEGDDLAKMPKTIGMGCLEISTVIEQLNPDLVVTMADRFETIATALSATCMNIPLAHIQGGETTGTIDNKIRWAITALADYHFPATTNAELEIYRNSDNRNNVFMYGCPSMDIMSQRPEFGRESYKSPLAYYGSGATINWLEKYVVVIFHPDTNEHVDVNAQVHILRDVLHMIPEQKVIMWPNIDPGSDEIAKVWREFSDQNARFIRNLDPINFGELLRGSSCIIGNSSAGIRESSFLGVPSVNIGNRQFGREQCKNTRSVSWDPQLILETINYQLSASYSPSNRYGDGHAGIKIASKLREIVLDP